MNRANGIHVKAIRTALNLYRAENKLIFEQYTTKRDAEKAYAQRFVDADAVFTDRRAKLISEARNQLKEKQQELGAEIIRHVAPLRESLMDSLAHPVNRAFVERVGLYRELGLKPSRIEIEGLVGLAEGHLAGLRAIDALLVQVDSELCITHVTIGELSKDLERLERFSKLVPPITSIEQIPVATEVLGELSRTVLKANQPNAFGYTQPGETLWTETASRGVEVPTLNAKGEVVTSYQTWDSIRLQAAQGAFAMLEDDLDALEGRWVAVGSPEVSIVSAAMTEPGENFRETEPEIVEGEGEAIELAKKLGAEQTERQKSLLNELRDVLA